MNLPSVAASSQPAPPVPLDGRAVIEAIADAVDARVAARNEALAREMLAAARPLLSLQDVAKTLAVSLRTVETLVGAGDLRVLWVGAQRRVHPDTLATYLRSRDRLKRR